MRREITTGSYWFYRRSFDKGSMNMEAILTETVDGGILQEAARRTIARLPGLTLRCEAAGDGRQYVLVPNERPFRVLPGSGWLSFDDPRTGGFLWSLAYQGNHLYLRVFHGLSDGLGMVTVMRYILNFYFSILTGGPLPPELAEPCDEGPDGPSYADPFDFARTTAQSYSFRTPEPLLFAPEDPERCVPLRRTLVLSLKEVLSASRLIEGSVSGLIALLLARSLDRMKDDPAKSVVVNCPINLRPLLGCTRTLQNCVSSVKYVYSERLKKMPPMQQASCFKGMLMLQSSEECLMNSFSDWKQEILKFNRETSMEEKRALLSRRNGMYPVVSYLGSFSIGAYDSLLEGIDFDMDLGGSVGMLAASFGDRLQISVLLSERNRAFLDILHEELDAVGVRYSLG